MKAALKLAMLAAFAMLLRALLGGEEPQTPKVPQQPVWPPGFTPVAPGVPFEAHFRCGSPRCHGCSPAFGWSVQPRGDA